MSDESLTLRRADGELDYVETLLERNGLPAGDVRSKPDCFYVGYDGGDGVGADGERAADGDRVGIGGLEVYGTDGLLRSVVVEETARGAGLGTALCERLEREAHSQGVERLYLLTTTAAGFFADRGYADIERTDAPEPIRETSEFADLCPASATCMRKSL